MNMKSFSLLDKTVQFTPEEMRMLGGLLEREVTRNDREWAATIAFLTVSYKLRLKPSRHRHKENERECTTVVQQQVSSIALSGVTASKAPRKAKSQELTMKEIQTALEETNGTEVKPQLTVLRLTMRLQQEMP